MVRNADKKVVPYSGADVAVHFQTDGKTLEMVWWEQGDRGF